MVEDLLKLSKTLDDKHGTLVEAIEKADPLSEDFGKLLNNYNSLMIVASNTNRTLMAIKQQAENNKVEKVEE